MAIYKANTNHASSNTRLWGNALREGYQPAIAFTELAILNLGRYGAADVLHMEYSQLCSWITEGLVRDLRSRDEILRQRMQQYARRARATG